MHIGSYWEVLEPHFESINIYKGQDTFSASISQIPRHIVLLYAAHVCQSEVHNGGFLQLFWNNSGILVPQAIEAYKTIGMPNLAIWSKELRDSWDCHIRSIERIAGMLSFKLLA